MESIGKYTIGCGFLFFGFAVVARVCMMFVQAVAATEIFGMPFGTVITFLTGTCTSVLIISITLFIVLRFLVCVEWALDYPSRRARRRLAETYHGVVWFDGQRWLPIGFETMVIEPAHEAPDRLLPITQYRNPRQSYRADWKKAAGAFLAIATEYGLSRRQFAELGVTQSDYETVTEKLLELGVLVYRNMKDKTRGYRIMNVGGNRPALETLLNLRTWEGANFDSPPPGIFIENLENTSTEPSLTNQPTVKMGSNGAQNGN